MSLRGQPVILLVGREGQVGWELLRTLALLGAIVSCDYPEIDLAKADSIRDWVRRVRPDVIVNAAAYTAVDQAEAEPERAMQINGAAPAVFAEAAKTLGALLVHYSTDYVFDGTQAEPYLETDRPNPLNAYGRSKLAGDEAIAAIGGDYLIFRLCWVYGLRGRNFLRTIQRLAAEQEVLRVVADQIGSPTWSRLIAEATALAVQQALRSPKRDGFTGTYHLSSAGCTSWHGFAEAIVASLPAEARRCQRVEAIATPDYPTPARRPRYSVLSGDKLQSTFGLRLPPWNAGLHLSLGVSSLH